jgi:hypothetical protein
VEPVGGGADHDYVAGLVHRIQACDIRRIGVGDDGDSVVFYPETGLPVPLDLMPCSLFRTREPDPTADVPRTTSNELRYLLPLYGAADRGGLCGRGFRTGKHRLYSLLEVVDVHGCRILVVVVHRAVVA